MMKRARGKRSAGLDPASIAAGLLLIVAVLLGGASRDHALRLALVELTALPLLVLVIQATAQPLVWRSHRLALGLLAAVLAAPLVQLILLPPGLWASLPGRDQAALALDLAGIERGWNAMSLAPELTWRSALALAPPTAMFLFVLTARQKTIGQLVTLLLLLTAISIILGAAQLVSGGEGLYPWATTDAGSVNGFFANRNHLATLALTALPFAIMLGAGAIRRREATARMWIAAIFTGLVIVAIAAIRSRAGVVLLFPVLTISFLAAATAWGRGRPSPAVFALLGSMGAAMTLVAALALPPLLARFDSQSAPEGRFDRWPTVAEAAQTYLPVGSGIGSFDAVYRSVEPLELLDGTFFNQAHNDYLETWLELGWIGAAVFALFLVWFARRAWTAWRAPPSGTRDLIQASTIALGVVLLHSAVDYPLRTVTIATVFALCCALLELAPRTMDQPRRRRSSEG